MRFVAGVGRHSWLPLATAIPIVSRDASLAALAIRCRLPVSKTSKRPTRHGIDHLKADSGEGVMVSLDGPGNA